MAKTRTDVTDKLAEIQLKTYPSTIAGKIESIEDHAELLGIETSYLGLTSDDPKLAASTEAVAGIINKGTIDEEVQEGETYTLVAGYYEGGTVKGVAGGGSYNLQAKSCTPTESEQIITPDAAYYGLSQVTVTAIPVKYKDVTGTNATAAQILTGYSAVTTTGKIEGTMVNNSAVSVTLTTASSSYTVPVGYHNGSGSVTVSSTTKTITPTESEQTITGDSNKFLSSVTVEAIDKETYLTSWTSDADAEAGDILTGKHAYVDGEKITGTMVDNTSWDNSDHILTTVSTNIAINVPVGYHSGEGTVKIVPESKTATAPAPGVGIQTITASTGKVLSQVTVPALDSKYQDVSGVTADAAHVCSSYYFVDASGTRTKGTLTDAGSLIISDVYNALLSSGASGTKFIDGGNAHYTAVECGISGDLYDRLAAI